MAIAALITWFLTAVGGAFMVASWVLRGGIRTGTSQLPPPVIVGHAGLASAGFIVWIVYLVTDLDALAWAAFGLLVTVALLGVALFLRWLPVAPARTPATAGGPGAASDLSPPESHFPVVVVAGHGVFAVVTVVLVLLTALGVGG